MAEDTTTAPETPSAETPPAENGWDGKIESLDPGVQKIITDLRKEAGDNRVKAKTATDQQQNILAAIAKAAGIDVPGDQPDPEKLAQSLTEAQTKAATAARELAIFKSAATAGADPSRLLDSNAFMTSVAGLDPNDGQAIQAAINAAVAANPLLKASQAAAASGTELGGTGETGQITEAQLAQMTPEDKAKAFREGKLNHLLA